MIYLKLFDTESNYLAYRYDKSEYIKPNVSLCDGNETVYYNYPPPNPNFNGYDYVDLALPSGTLWSTCNVGASKPSDYGLYFAWGDTQGYTSDQVGNGDGKKKFSPDYSDYKWGTYKNFTKYTVSAAILELEDDAAHVHMGGDWHMPTPQQIQELLDNTTHPWTTQNGVNGRLFTSKTDTSKSIFIPAAGSAWDGSVVDSRSRGCVLSCMTVAKNSMYVQVLDFNSGNAYLNTTNYHNRCSGLSVRGVIG